MGKYDEAREPRTVIKTNTPEQQEAFLFEAMMRGGTTGMVEAQEKQGQQSFTLSDVLPVKGSSDEEAELMLEAFGFELGPKVEGDQIWRYSKLPEGWKKVGTDHDMWSKIVDEHGRERIMVFYKAAFYDRSAHMSISQPWSYVDAVALGKVEYVEVPEGEWGSRDEVLTMLPKLIESEEEKWEKNKAYEGDYGTERHEKLMAGYVRLQKELSINTTPSE